MRNILRKISITKACVHGGKLQVEYTVTACAVRQGVAAWTDFVELSSMRSIDLTSLALSL